MKKLRQLLTILFPAMLLLAGCHSFYHAHYGDLEKVPAEGIRAVPGKNEAQLSYPKFPKENSVRTRRTSPLTQAPPDSAKQKSSPKKNTFSCKIPQPGKISSSAKKYVPVKKTERRHGHASFWVVMTILAEFFLGLLVVGEGVGLIWAAFFTGRPILAGIGVLLIFIGLPPVMRMFHALFHRKKKNKFAE